MGRKKKQDPMDYIRIPEMNISSETKRGILIIIVLILAALSLLGLFDLAGAFGRYLAKGEMLLFGWGKWFFPLALFAWGFFWRADFTGKDIENSSASAGRGGPGYACFHNQPS